MFDFSFLKDAIRNIVNRQSKSNYNTVSRTEGNYCIHVPNLPKSIKMELFGNYSANNSSSKYLVYFITFLCIIHRNDF